VKRLAAATVLAVVPVLWTPLVADATGATCQGKRATIVGKAGGTVRGTTGPDVVVSRGASFVFTGDGADVICVTGSTKDGYRVKVMSDAGNDSVLITGSNTVRATLGGGDDTYGGGDEIDLVEGDLGADTIRTGGGNDHVSSAGNDDTISLGRGDDYVSLEAPAAKNPTGKVDGGPGRNAASLDGRGAEGEGPGSWVLDNRVRTLSRNGEVRFSWTGFTRFDVSVDGPLLMQGSKRDESFEATAFGKAVAVKAGGGDDEIRVGIWTQLNVESIDGGPGRDLVDVEESRFTGDASFVLDLADGRYSYRDSDGAATVPLIGIEDAEVTGFPEVTMRGDSSANRLTAGLVQEKGRFYTRCPVTVSGRAGDDSLIFLSAPLRLSSKDCPAPTLQGGGGDDLLVGSREDERLLGGAGHDVARGGPGADVCIAETTMNCERR
jgi:Ca2+-binding RTX toxin-like protein